MTNITASTGIDPDPKRKHKELKRGRGRRRSARQLKPRFGTIADAENYGGVKRSKLYDLAARYPGLFKKIDAATVVDFNVYDTILDALPDAQIKPTFKPTS